MTTLALVAATCVSLVTGPSHAHADSAAGGTITIGGKCLDDPAFSTADGTALEIYGCNGGANQNFSWQGDGSVTVLGRCLDIAGSSNANGSPVGLNGCNSQAAGQKFSRLPDGTIYSAKSGKCLQVQGALGATPPPGIGLEPCNTSNSLQQWNATPAPASPYTLTSGVPAYFQRVDDTPSTVYTDQNGRFNYQSANSGYLQTGPRHWNFFTGTNFDTATKASISNSGTNPDTTALCNNSPTGVDASYAPSRSQHSQRNFCDLVGVWVDPDTGWWYGLVHNEFTPEPFGDGYHYDAIDYAVSKDKGATWTIQDHAITSPYSTKRGDTGQFPNQTYYYGDGDPRLFVDYRSGYFYVFYLARLVDKAGTWGGFSEHVARAPISQKMAPASWTKWYDGSWSTAGAAGAESDIIPSNGVGPGYIAPGDDYSPNTTGSISSQIAAGRTPPSSQLSVMNIAWDAYLGKYIGTPENETGADQPQHFYVTDDLATEQWTDIGSTGNAQSSWYRWLLDSGNLTSSTIVGKTFRTYCAVDCRPNDSQYTPVTITSTSLPTPVTGTTYQIAAGNGQHLAQSGSSLTTTSADGNATSQLWTFTPTGDGFYTITNFSSGQALGVGTGDSARSWGASVGLGTLGATPAVGQQWSIQTIVQSPRTSGASTPAGTYRLVNRYSDLALSLTGGSLPAATSPQRGWDNAGTSGDTRPASAQTLTFTATTPATLNGTHLLTISGQALDDPDFSTAHPQLDTWPSNHGQNQNWVLSQQPDGSYTVKNAYSNQCADDELQSLQAGARVIQYDCGDRDNQKWNITQLPSGAYTITNLHSGHLLTTASTSNGAALTQQPDTGSSLQHWTIS
ncbi:RICIN domain-containing protein [Kitasatospora azatica]|uniref:RICIN domain-containing protein n=1 Tax=Kitasatospora azatica TaxID=58347 RepID=UPI001E5A3EEC|nr:RICIN domain-containing protein [Kitasatospora azatica]